ncbi:GTPase-associated protein 1-related protein [Paractinoplanes lichenicola]|uniref:Uncharacterized protein n=1 Tax=Paractinoplanes lichenicola TaxID=2802976 RepID=A0ABS1VUA0_9ACTN|nr:GTPase-associated protein 1-related protein [Actinoplanes lichenicola]MBL7258036.1 hypothetical protein [Actinoplanes lichenicola]
MTARFETLIYTDCRPGQGLDGSPGLQFQARSAESVLSAKRVVQDNLLYQPYSAWMSELRPVEDYPPSFGHVAEAGFFATGAGRYLGHEANGTRQGNQLTHAIVTTDTDAYRGLRPAQLFGADFWTGRPAPTTTSEPVELGHTTAVHTPARARDFVLAQPQGEHLLRTLVAALAGAGRPGQPRVLFVGADVPVIVNWLVAGSLLLPRKRAFELGFKIFAVDPARSTLPVLAVHPDFAGAAGRIDNQLGYAVFDLTRNECTPVPFTWAAQHWVDLFLAEDPRDVVDALDVAADSTLAERGDDGPRAQRLAMALGTAAIMRREPEVDFAEEIVDWLRTGPPHLRDAYAFDVADLFADMPERWPRRVLVRLDAVGCDGLLPGKAADVRTALAINEITAAREQGRSFDEPVGRLPDGEWTEDHAADLFRSLVEELTAGVPPKSFAALLRVAKRFGAAVHPDHLGDEGAAFVRHWADHPGDYQPAAWPEFHAQVARVTTELTRRVRQGPEQAAIVGDGWRKWLLPRLDELDPDLRAAVLGATVRHGDGRWEVVESQLSEAKGDPFRFAATTAALWSQSSPTRAELELVATVAPDGITLPARLWQPLVADVTGTSPLAPDDLKLCRLLLTRLLMPLNRRVETLLAADDELTTALTGIGGSSAASEEQTAALLACLRRTPTRLIAMRAGAAAAALVRVSDYDDVERMLTRHSELLDPYLRRLGERLRAGVGVSCAVAACFLGGAWLAEDPARQEPLLEAWDEWLVRAPERNVELAGQRVAKSSKDWREFWKARVGSVSGRRRRYRLAHPFGGGR